MPLILFAVFGIALSVLTCTQNMLSFWVGIPIALGYALAALLAFFLLAAFSTLFVRLDRPANPKGRFYRWLLGAVAETGIALLRVRVHVTGMELLPQGTRFLLVSNHRSNFDPPVHMFVFRKYQLSFISKKENYKIPFVNKLMHRCFCLPLDRDDNRAAVKTILQAADLMKKDVVCMGIFPEGRRNNTDEILLPFRNGAFKIAQRANVPVVVTTIWGTDNILRNFPLRHTDVEVHILGVISPSDDVHQQTKEISDIVWPMMEKDLLASAKNE